MKIERESTKHKEGLHMRRGWVLVLSLLTLAATAAAGMAGFPWPNSVG
jgi:hypothetical protein